MGGMTKAIESGWAKLKIEEAAPPRSRRASTPARTSSSASTSTASTRRPDRGPRDRQQRRARGADRPAAADPRHARRRRRSAGARALTDGAKTGQGNLLDLAVAAARVRATVGEISDALEKANTAATAHEVQSISGVYRAD
jgi:methylmalonyl-CoA mutase